MTYEETNGPPGDEDQELQEFLEQKQHENSALLKILQFVKEKTVDTTPQEE